MALPPLNSYQDPEVLTPPDEPDDDTCDWCGEWYCGPDCTPRFVSPYRSRMVPRVESGDPDS